MLFAPEELMKKFAAALVLALVCLLPTSASARGSHSSGRSHYSSGGHYSGGHGSSHKGGHYVNSRTRNHYRPRHSR